MSERYEKRNNTGEIKTIHEGYAIEAEIGQLKLETHQIKSGERVIYNTGSDIFPKKSNSEYYRSPCFDDLLLSVPTKESYRESEDLLNRIRWQESDKQIKYRTIANMIEKEGAKINQHIESKAIKVLEETNIKYDSKGVLEVPKNIENIPKIEYISDTEVFEAVEKYNEGKTKNFQIEISELHESFENPVTSCINMSIDDVQSKKQKEHGRKKNSEQKKKRSWVKNTVVHIQKDTDTYVYNSVNINQAFRWLVAFLFINSIYNAGLLVFFVDGAADLKAGIKNHFSWIRYKVILDWHHLEKKCEQRLSSAIKGKDARNDVLKILLSYLWVGKVELAIKYLEELDSSKIKSSEEINKLIDYFNRNLSNIPCYALRASLGLRNSSNPVEKANDLLVSNRQKDNGTSWSKDGSVSLATVTALRLNNEMDNWIRKRDINFTLKEAS